MDPHVAEALKTMSKGINDFTKASSSAIDRLTSKIDTMSATVMTMQDQLQKQAELLETGMGQVGEASKSSTSTSEALILMRTRAANSKSNLACENCMTLHQQA